MNNKLGNSIKLRRNELGLSQSELSRLSGVDRTTISKIESGERKNPLITTLNKIFRILDMDIYDIMNEKIKRIDENYINCLKCHKCFKNNNGYDFIDEDISEDVIDEEDEYEGIVNYVITIDGEYKIKGKNKNEILEEATKEICNRFYSLAGESEVFDEMMEYADVDITTTYIGERF